MIELKSGTKVIKAEFQQPTVARYREYQNIVNDLQKVVDTYGQFKRNVAIAELIKKYPDVLGDLVNSAGGFNESTYNAKVKKFVEVDKLPQAEAEQKAAADIVERLHLAAADNKEIFVTLVSPEVVYPLNYNSIIIGIDVIKKTIDKSKLTANEKKLLDSDEFWDNVEWEGVCKYIDSFRTVYQ